jgi:hypothetical protein
VVRKFDRKLVLFVALLYMLSFLDRSSLSYSSGASSLLTFNRYWKCEDRGPRRRPAPRL